jgi:hypothetical protein
MLGKECPLTFNEVRDRYEMFRARCLNGVPSIPKHNDEKKEIGCDAPLYGVKAKTVIHVVPIDKKCDPINIDPKCTIKRKYNVPEHKTSKSEK